jgi:hypothetical protein
MADMVCLKSLGNLLEWFVDMLLSSICFSVKFGCRHGDSQFDQNTSSRVGDTYWVEVTCTSLSFK